MKKFIIGFFVLFALLVGGISSAQAISILPYPSPYSDPVVSGISGPQSLMVGQTGTWKINAYDPQGGNLSYSVDWGDAVYYNTCSISGAPCLKTSLISNFNQSAVFSHSYTHAGNYNPTFTIINSNGQSISTSLSVNIKGNEVKPFKIGISKISGPRVLSIGQTGTWKVSAYGLNESNLSYSVDWGDNIYYLDSNGQAFLGTKITQNATFNHSYRRAGIYKIKFTVNDDRGHSVSKILRVRVKNIGIINYNINR